MNVTTVVTETRLRGNAWPVPLRSLARRAVDRMHDRRFWYVQAGVATITVAHAACEATGFHDEIVGRAMAVPQILVLLYLVPVVYASLEFGLEGGAMAGLSCAVLAAPNVVLWHLGDFEWLSEGVSTAVVLSVGVAVAVPVERERHQWRRAEATSRRLALVNDFARRLAAATDPDAVMDELLDDLVVALDALGAAAFVADTGRLFERGQAGAGRGNRVVVPLAVADLDLGWLAVTPSAGTALGPGDEALLSAVAHHLAVELDNARLQRLERDRLQEYARRVTAAHEEERTRVARELHDDVAQPLVELVRGLGRFADLDDLPAGALDHAEDLRGLAVGTLGTVRRFSAHLRPPVLDDLGLVAALHRLTRDEAARTAVGVAFTIEGAARRLPADVEVAAYRIVQEALRNVERHACASHVTLSVSFGDRFLAVEVDDDGCGIGGDCFDVVADAGGVEHHFGIVGMQERAALVGGTLTVGPRAGGGTAVRVVVPV